MKHAEATPERERRAPIVLRVGYRNAGQFLVSYCTNLSRGGVFVRTPTPLTPGTTVRLDLKIPGRDSLTAVMATVRWVRERANRFGPPGMGLAFDNLEHSLGFAIDGLVAEAQPLRIDLVGPNALGSRHLGALVQSLLNCKVHHRELRRHVARRCATADLVIVDLQPQNAEALSLLESLATSVDAPPVMALCASSEQELAQTASEHARVVSTPVDRGEFQRSILETLSQVTWIREKRATPTAAPSADEDIAAKLGVDADSESNANRPPAESDKTHKPRAGEHDENS